MRRTVIQVTGTESLTVVVVARPWYGSWQGGVSCNGAPPEWYGVFRDKPEQVLDAMASHLVVDVEDDSLVIYVNATQVD